jgi:predicted nucleotide-binding protein (sugar kinase/HSP70/actin superfamily)
MKITFADWGNYTIAFKALIKRLNIEVIPPEKTNPKVIEEGAKLSPDLFCFPLKVNIGNYLPALRKGADTIFMWENLGGSCRLRYYWIIQAKILREAGFKVKVLNLNSQNLLTRLKEIKNENKISYWEIIQAILLFFKEINFIEAMEKKAQSIRPREKKPGQVDQVLFQTFERLGQVNNSKDLVDLRRVTKEKLSEIEIDSNRGVLKVGVIGEIYTIVDGAVNFGLERKLGQMGIEVHRKLNLTQHLLGGLFPWQERRLQRRVSPYLKTTVGGHGRQAIEEMLDFAKEKFDGIIQLLPFGCMPEITVRPILQEISRKNNLPFLSISLDEQTSEAGIQTRLEAFVDLMKSKKQKQLTI